MASIEQVTSHPDERTFASILWTDRDRAAVQKDADVAVMSITQSGSHVMFVTMLGVLRCEADDVADVASYLEQLAEFMRRNAIVR